jgi:glycosyltransferase involved in cell wall biosynthesis
VAFFTDSFHEANGVATLSREFSAFAQREQLPFLCAYGDQRTEAVHERSFTTLKLKRGFASFPLDHDLYCDPLLTRHKSWVIDQLQEFQPDLIHITGPGDVGILGAWIAHTIRVPLVASWHTNLHEYAGRRLERMLPGLPAVSAAAERKSLWACMRFYRTARMLLAPNEDMVRLLEERTGKPAFLMEHGVDTAMYSPSRRTRGDGERAGPFRIGYVGRLTPEKNVRLFAGLERRLMAAGQRDFKFVLIGDGNERVWLRDNLQFAETPGILRGAALAEAFANLDVFVFPSETDTFGLVLLEAMASGVPVIASPETGERVGVRHGVAGFHASNLEEFTQSLLLLLKNEDLRKDMSAAARRFAAAKEWNDVFEQLYQTYEGSLETRPTMTEIQL